MNKNFNFYFSGSRFWEFLLGSFIALNYNKINNVINAKLVLTIGLIFLFLSIFFTFTNNFKFLQIILITFGTALVILTCNSLRINKNVFVKSLLFIGTSSFSIYLVHQPIISFYKNVILHKPNFVENIVLFCFSIFIGYLFYFLFERRFYFNLKKLIFLNSFLIIFGFLVHLSDGFMFRFNKAALDGFNSRKSLSKNIKNCADRNFQDSCVFNRNYDYQAVIWGDSHLNQLDQSLINILSENNLSTRELFLPGCPPYEVIKRKCKKNKDYLNQIIKDDNIKLIVLHAYWINYILNSLDKEKELGKMKKLLIELSKDKKIIIIGDVPKMNFHVPKAFFLKNIWIYKNKFMSIDLNEKKYSTYILETKITRDLFNEVSKLSNVYFYDISKNLCDQNENICFYLKDKNVLYRDDNHLSLNGAKLLKKDFSNLIDQIFKN